MNRKDDLNEVKATQSRCGIEVSAYMILTDFTDPKDFKSEDFINDLDIASKLGAPFVRVLGGDVDESSRGYSNMIEGLIRGSELAGERNLILILENIGHHSGHSAALKRLLLKLTIRS